jgi:hypothetical protein
MHLSISGTIFNFYAYIESVRMIKLENARTLIYKHQMSDIEIKSATTSGSDDFAALPFLGRSNEFTDDESDEPCNNVLDERTTDEVFDGSIDEKSNVNVKKWRGHIDLGLMRELAISRGGKCLSDSYKNAKSHLTWQCKDGHVWDATPHNIVYNESWCPTCPRNVGEELVRAAMVECFPGKTFERTRQEEWLNGLELDGYNEELKLAFEYQGIQHSKHVPHFQRKPNAFEDQCKRDARKREYCAVAGIRLIEVSHKIKPSSIRPTVRKILSDIGFKIADATMSNDEFYDTSRAGSNKEELLKLAQSIAKNKGGKCISTVCISKDCDLVFECNNGHTFTTSIKNINQRKSRGPRFCQICGGTRKRSDDEIRERVEAIRYRLISIETKFVGNRNRRWLTVQCPNGHDQYGTVMENLIRKDGSLKRGCEGCGHIKTGKSKKCDLTEWSEETGLIPLDEYERRSDNIRWKCRRGHIFEARLDSLQSKKTLCSACWLVNYATARGFEILSDIRNNVKKGDDIIWRCMKCNQFEKVASRVSVSKKELVCKACK